MLNAIRKRFGRQAVSPPAPRRVSTRSPLCLEQLEDRCVPASFTVTTTNDTQDAVVGDGFARDAAGQTSLRAAIEEGNHANSGANVSIGFSGVTGSITLSTALPSLNKNYTITGAGGGLLNTISILRSYAPGTPNFRIFTVSSGHTSSFSNLTLMNGASGAGGAIYLDANSTLTVTACDILSNTATGMGGGIASLGNLQLYGTLVQSNTAGATGGGIAAPSGTLSLDMDAQSRTTQIWSNTANGGGGGGGLHIGELATAYIDGNTTISYNNAANADAGGIRVDGTLWMYGGSINNNRAQNLGGGIKVLAGGFAYLGETSLTSNEADEGGGFYTAGSLVLDACLVFFNTATLRAKGGTVDVGGQLQDNNSVFGADQDIRYA